MNRRRFRRPIDWLRAQGRPWLWACMLLSQSSTVWIGQYVLRNHAFLPLEVYCDEHGEIWTGPLSPGEQIRGPFSKKFIRLLEMYLKGRKVRYRVADHVVLLVFEDWWDWNGNSEVDNAVIRAAFEIGEEIEGIPHGWLPDGSYRAPGFGRGALRCDTFKKAAIQGR